MDYFAGLDVSSICIVDDTGKIVWEVKAASEPQALLAVVKNPAYDFRRIGLEGRCRNGYSALSPKQSCRWFVFAPHAGCG